MSTVSASATPWWRNPFIWRKLHSLMGVVPLGAFLLFHFFENSYVWKGSHAYDVQVEWIVSMPILPLLEMALLGSLLFHAIYGTVIMRGWKGNVAQYAYVRNWLYDLQRITAWISFFFIGYHVLTLRFLGEAANHAKVAAQLDQPWVFMLYLVGVVAVVFHFSTGLVNVCFKWGVTVGSRSQRVVASLMAVFGVGFTLLWVGILGAFLVHNNPQLLSLFK